VTSSPITRFYLGTHQPRWLWDRAADFRMFVSHRTLTAYKTLRPSTAPWALDSGGFTELSKFGRWMTSPREYAEAVARYDRVIGHLEWAAPQDWMCEPDIIHGGGPRQCPGTRLSVGEHQHRTVTSFLQLRDLWPTVSDRACPVIPVLQGWRAADYDRCAAMYEQAGIRLEDFPVVGIGSVCRRQGTAEIGRLAESLAARGLALHGFGVKTLGLLAYGRHLSSADSLAWSFDARRGAPLPGHRHKNCANCLPYAIAWRDRLLDGLAAADARGHQQPLFPLAYGARHAQG
jgi:hypothetical protein